MEPSAETTGAYTAERASVITGVPRSTIHAWARTEVLIPSISAERVKLWSDADLAALQTIYWLRHRKRFGVGAEIPATSMHAIRRALARLRALGEPLCRAEGTSLWVDADGEVHVRGPAGFETRRGQLVLPGALDLVAPFTPAEARPGRRYRRR